jgi:hypothetical protein
MMIAVSRRDLRGFIASAGSEATGLAPPSIDRKGIGSVSMRKHRDCFAYALATNLHHQASDFRPLIVARIHPSLFERDARKLFLPKTVFSSSREPVRRFQNWTAQHDT